MAGEPARQRARLHATLLKRPEVRARYVQDQMKWVLHVPGRCKNVECGGCRHCGLPVSDYPPYSADRLEEELSLLRECAPQLGVCVVKAGTFGSWSEVPEKGRLAVYAAMRDLAGDGKELQVEFRPELVDPEIVHELYRYALWTGRAVVEIGLDHWDRWARCTVLRRNHTLRDFRQAVRAVRSFGQAPAAFVAIGLPLGWSEWEAIGGAIATAQLAIAAGCERIWLEPVVLQPGTLQQYLYDRGLWEPAWLWSIRSVILEVWGSVADGVQILVGGPVHEPPPDPASQPSNRCDKCKRHFRAAFAQVATGSIEELRDLECDCINRWRETLDRVFVPRRDASRVLREFDEWRAEAVMQRSRGR